MSGVKNIWSRLRPFAAYNLLLFCSFILLISIHYDLYDTIFPVAAGVLCFAYLITGIGAYFFNDLTDISSDRKTGKFNSTQLINKYVLLALVMLLWLGGSLLVNRIMHGLLVIFMIQLALLVLYSVPLIRLKEKGILGVITDACYAHVVPVIMLLVLANDFIVLPVAFALNLVVIAFCIGMRDMLIHQVHDKVNDLDSGVKTFVLSHQRNAKKYILLFEVLTAVSIITLIIHLYLYREDWAYLIMLTGLAAYYIYFYLIKTFNLLNDNVSLRGYIIISSLVWLSFIVINHWYGLLLFIIHPYFLSFLNKAANKTWLAAKYVFKIWLGNLLIRFIPFAINVLLYYCFLAFGRDLKRDPLYKKENEFIVLKKIRRIFQ